MTTSLSVGRMSNAVPAQHSHGETVCSGADEDTALAHRTTADDTALHDTGIPLTSRLGHVVNENDRDAALPDAAIVSEAVQPRGHEEGADTDGICVQIEAFGSGVVLHPGLRVPFHKRLGEFRKLVFSSIVLPTRTRSIRLFIGHGGSELHDEDTLISDTPLAAAFHNTPLVVFPTVCTSHSQQYTNMMAVPRTSRPCGQAFALCHEP